MTFNQITRKASLFSFVAFSWALLGMPSGQAAVTDIANAPLFTSSVSNVKSNIMFIFDDSGSMDGEDLPDDVPSNSGKYAQKTYQCNGVAFNPAITYVVPIKADGTYYPNASFTAAKDNGFSTSNTTISLNNNNAYYFRYSGSQPALQYSYDSSSNLITTSTFYRECNSNVYSSPGSSVFTQIDVQTATAAVKQNYANWYTYYRKRLLMMKSSVGLAFATVDSKYRVGFNVISNKSASGSKFLDIKDFDSDQKIAFYSALYGVTADSYTPLRGALSRAGQYFAKKAPGQTVDPVQYSCQKNFTILSTDGYWNTDTESTNSPKYGPYQLDNTTAVGQQDGDAARPMYDGGGVTYKSKTNQLQSQSITAASETVISQLQKQTTTTQFAPTTAHLEKQISQWQATTSYLQSRSRTNNSASWGAWSTAAIPSCTVKTSYPKTECQYGRSSISDVSTCAINVPTINNNTNNANYTITSAISACSYRVQTAYTPVDTCVVNSTPNGSGQTSQCQYGSPSTASSGSYTNTCTVSSSASVSAYSVAVNTSACPTRTALTSGYTDVTSGSCSATTTPDVSGNTTQCQYNPVSTVTAAGTCTATPPSPSSPFTVLTATQCNSAPNILGAWTDATSCTTSSSNNCRYAGWTSSWQTVNSCTKLDPSSSPNYTVGLATDCQVTSNGGSTDSLADVAMYYYKTDLRDSSLSNCTGALNNSVCDNNVAGGGRDIANHQHMTTFTLGLGNSGTLTYDSKYLSQSAGDYFDIVQGTQDWPVPNGKAANIDDLWHAAVDGRGQFFSASEPMALTAGLNSALDAIKAITGAASAAATSSLQPVQGNNDIYVAQFTSAKWVGDVSSYKISPDTGAVSSTATWSAQAKLDVKTPDSRTIYYPQSGALREFSYTNLSATLKANFDNFCSKPGVGATSAPSQCSSLNLQNNTIANVGLNLVDYLRGTQTYSDDLVYRSREHVMGDVINASPLFVGKPAFKYTENGYSSFTSTSTRQSVIYAAANDGMLHAIDQATGNELWAYIPSFVMPNLYKLADSNYANNHIFTVDGSPVMGDIFVTDKWKTILVGGLNSGGRGYYALDITDPAAPKLLWEYSEDDLGLTFGNPVITKKSDGTWVVLFSSGYNNVSPGDGNGHLYMLNANTGALLLKLDTNTTPGTATPAGTTTTPSGLGKINNYVESEINNTAKVVYGGDLLGNVWRFDINSLVLPYLSAMRLAELKVSGKAQPITTRPALAEVTYNGAKYKVLYVGTGEYLGTSDLANTDKQTIYALKDTWSETGLGNVRTATNPAMVVQTASAATSLTQGNIITGTANPVNWTTDMGWYMDFISSGERVSVNPLLVLNSLYVGTNVPKTDACTVGGTSWLYKLDIAKGSAIPGSTESAVAVSLGNVLIMGMTNVQLTTGYVATIVTRSDGTLDTVGGAQPSSTGERRRTSWRMLK